MYFSEKGPSEKDHINYLNLGTQADNDPALNVKSYLSDFASDAGLEVEKVETIMVSVINSSILISKCLLL